MKDMQAHLEKLRMDAEECALVSKLAIDKRKRELFARLSKHLNTKLRINAMSDLGGEADL
jgi:hypothetical protein